MRWQAILSGRQSRNLYQCAQVPPADVADRRDDLCIDPSAAAAMVSCDLSSDADQARHLQHRMGRRLGVTQTTAWKIKHKLKQVSALARCDQAPDWQGRHRRCLSRRRTLGGKQAEAPARRRSSRLSTTTEGKPVRLKLRRVTSFSQRLDRRFAKRSLDPNCSVVSDGLQCFTSVADAGCAHRVVRRQDQKRLGRQPSNGSTPRSATSRPPSQGLPCHQQQACSALPRRIRIPLQPTIRSGRHDPAPPWAAVRTIPMPYRL